MAPMANTCAFNRSPPVTRRVLSLMGLDVVWLCRRNNRNPMMDLVGNSQPLLCITTHIPLRERIRAEIAYGFGVTMR